MFNEPLRDERRITVNTISESSERSRALSILLSATGSLPKRLARPTEYVSGRFTVIVPAFNAERTLGACLESLRALDWPDFEVVVVDDASTDATARIAALYPYRLLRLPKNVGPGLARNAGADFASGEFLAFTDSDCVVPRLWLRRFAEAFGSPDVVAVTGGYAESSGESLIERYQLLSLAERQRHLPASIESSISSNLASRRTVFEEVGGFPEYYLNGLEKPIWGNEDEELGFLLSRRGKVLWHRENGITHNFRGRLGHYARQQVWFAERIMLSHCVFPAMRVIQTNYSRMAVVLALLCAFVLPAIGVGALLVHALLSCRHHYTAVTERVVDICCALEASAALGVGVGLFGWLLLQVSAIRFYARHGEDWRFQLLALGLAYLGHLFLAFGSLRGLVLARRGIVK